MKDKLDLDVGLESGRLSVVHSVYKLKFVISNLLP